MAVPVSRDAPLLRTVEQHSAGGLVVRGDEVLLIAPREGRWQLPKGHVEPGEAPAQAALREVREETGVHGRIVAPLPTIDYTYAVGRGVQVHKRVDYYLMTYESGSELDCDPREVLQARWWSWDEALDALTFDNERGVAAAARQTQEEVAR
jgi:8-oxo-dGTP pyrophosphatase MutT (NUDIX family)